MISVKFDKAAACLVCESVDLSKVFEFGIVPLADKLPRTQDESVPSAPLTVWKCNSCGHLQVGELVSPTILFKHEYPYLSTKIPEVDTHFRNLAELVVANCGIGSKSFVMEVASNDGVFLKNLSGTVDKVFGIEPSTVPARACEKLGIEVSTEFFSLDLAKELLKQFEGRHPDLILASNVLSHVPDPRGFMAGLAVLINDTGKLVVEVPYGLNMLMNGTFDSIFHQHCSYFTMHSIQRLVDHFGLCVKEVELVKAQGGSLRLIIEKGVYTSSGSVDSLLEKEQSVPISGDNLYKRFAIGIESHRLELTGLLQLLKSQGKTIVGYGAAGKSATLLNYYGITDKLLEYIVDISPSKHYRFFPFTGLEIFPVERLLKEPPDYVVILAWNYTDEVLLSLSPLRDRGVKFIQLYPTPEVV